MKWTIPGTVLQIEAGQVGQVEQLLSAMFLAGGISQARFLR